MLGRLTAGLRADARGSVAVVFGLLVPALIGFTGLAVDGAFWLKERNRLQAASDSAAISAAQALQLDGGKANLPAEAKKMIAKTFGAGAAAVSVTVQNPPAEGAEAGNNSAVAVIAERDQKSFFLAAVGIDNVKVRTRAVAKIDSTVDACLLSLAPAEDRAIEVTGNANANLGCGMASNSNSSEAIYLSGNSTTKVSGLSAVGDILRKNNANVDMGVDGMKTHIQSVSDPYGPQGRNLKPPATPTGCLENNLKIKNDQTLSPGRYCGGIDFQGGTTTLSPGVYIIDAGDFKANAQAAIKGDNVTIILTASNSNNIGRLHINGGSDVSLSAPKSGTAYDGILFFQDPTAASKQGNSINTNYMNGNATMNLSGVMYFPNQEVRFSGGTDSNISCLQIVSYTVRIDGNGKISNTCPANSGASKITRKAVELVE